MMTDSQTHSLAGQTQRWTFTSGPTAGTTYEHSFKEDGTVSWKDVKGAGAGTGEPKAAKAKPEPTPYASFEVGPGMHLVSYLSKESGYTLTILVNTTDRQLHGFASSATDWTPLEGRLE